MSVRKLTSEEVEKQFLNVIDHSNYHEVRIGSMNEDELFEYLKNDKSTGFYYIPASHVKYIFAITNIDGTLSFWVFEGNVFSRDFNGCKTFPEALTLQARGNWVKNKYLYGVELGSLDDRDYVEEMNRMFSELKEVISTFY